MSELARMACGFGGVLLLLNTPLVAAPAKARELLLAFPRNRWAAWILTAVALYWSWYLIDDIHLGRLEVLKKWLPLVALVSYALIVTCMDDLLAPRALGGILLLIPAPILATARFNESAFRYVMIVLAYAMVIKGIALVLSPFFFRKWIERFMPNEARCRLFGQVGLGVAVALIVLGLTAY